MRIEFQQEIVKFMVQEKRAIQFYDTIQTDFFKTDIFWAVYDNTKEFYKEFKKLPSLEDSLTYLEQQNRDLEPEVQQIIEAGIKSAYRPIETNLDLIEKTLVSNYQFQLLKDLLVDTSGKVKEADPELIDQVMREAQRISAIGKSIDEEVESNRGKFLFAEHDSDDMEFVEGSPTYLVQLNRMTSARGFYPPQLIVFMAGPKSMKTGLVLNILLNYAIAGKKVFYVDCENGHKKLQDRLRQCLLEATFMELVSGELNSVLDQIVGKAKRLGGDFKVHYFPANTKSMVDVDAELDYLKEAYDWEPDMIAYDYLDLLEPEDKTVIDKRLKIQSVYHDAIRLQKRRNIFGFTLSQVGRNGAKKDIIGIEDIAEDFGKVANAHAIFAICAGEPEKIAGVARIIPAAQRDGVGAASGAACYIDINANTQNIKEISYQEWKNRVQVVEGKAVPLKQDSTRGRNKRNKLIDN